METNIKQTVSSHQLVGQKYIYSESALLLPFCQDSNLKRDLMGNNESSNAKADIRFPPKIVFMVFCPLLDNYFTLM